MCNPNFDFCKTKFPFLKICVMSRNLKYHFGGQIDHFQVKMTILRSNWPLSGLIWPLLRSKWPLSRSNWPTVGRWDRWNRWDWWRWADGTDRSDRSDRSGLTWDFKSIWFGLVWLDFLLVRFGFSFKSDRTEPLTILLRDYLVLNKSI